MALAGLSGKIAAVTGAGSGIGRAVAYRFAKEGVALALADINIEAVQQTVKEVQTLDGKAISVKVDVSNSAEVANLFEAVVREYGTLDILVNCAGIMRETRGVLPSDEVWHQVMSTNLYGTFYCIREALKIMEPKRSGCIVSTSSVSGTRQFKGPAAYCASKAGIYSLTRTLAAEVAPKGIRVNAVAPGYVDTNIVAYRGDVNSEVRKEVESGIPLVKRYAYPSEIADLIAFLASDEASYITGELVGAHAGIVSY